MDTRRDYQRGLSEMLQLLRILDQQPIADPGTDDFNLTKADKVELKIMDNIAWFLASRSTDFVTVTLRKDMPLTFVLAKNRGMPDNKDITMAKEFFDSMRDASTWQDVMPCFISNSAERINMTLAALAAFQFEGIFDGETPYVPGELHEEFSEVYTERFVELFHTQDPLEILKCLFHRVRDRATFEFDPNCTTNPDELNAQLFKLTLVTATSESLLLTKLLRENINREVDWAVEYRDLVRQVSRYMQGIADLITFRRRFFAEGSKIPYVWLEDVHQVDSEQKPKEVDIQLSDSAWAAIQSLSQSLRSYESISADEYHANPNSSILEKQWRPTIHPIRHVVPRMITHLDKDRFYTAHPRLVGTSAQLCLCCARWLTEYDDSGGWHRKWMTSNPIHGMDVGADWAIGPGAPRFSSRLDDEVYEMVLQRVTGVLKGAGLLREIEVEVPNMNWDSMDVAELLDREDMWD